MARGFESKDVEFQQSEAERPRSGKKTLTAEERDAVAKRGTLALALSRTESDLALAQSPAHRRMLEQAITALRHQMRDT